VSGIGIDVRPTVLLLLLVLPSCHTSSTPGRDAVQDAFREGSLTAAQSRGHRVFLQRCATCHGPEGRGDGQNAYNLSPAPPDFRESLARVSAADRRRIVEQGTAALDRSPLCPPWGRSLDPDDVDAVLAWLEVVARRPREEPASGEARPDD
jgi:mono/diheme cytochrome c family protein